MHGSHQEIKRASEISDFFKKGIRFNTSFCSTPEFCHVFTYLECSDIALCSSRAWKLQKIKPHNQTLDKLLNAFNYLTSMLVVDFLDK